MGCHKRGPWSQAEDLYLLQLVQSQGAHNWVRISHLITTRSPKQCRERFHQNLKPSLNHDPITPEEGALIERLVGEMGKRWAEIARRLRGRSDNAVKNWWNGSINRRHRISVWRETGRRGRPECDDDRADHLHFEQTVSSISHAPKTILIPSHSGMIEMPMVSPVASEVSMVDSVGTAPSLVSDSSSNTSTSPNVSKISHSRLQPLQTLQTLRFATSLPSLHGLDGSDAMSDGSSPVQRNCDQGKSTATQYQRLQQFADVATRTSTSTVYHIPQRAISVTQYQLPSFNSLIHGAEPQPTSVMNAQKSPPTRAVMSVSAILGWGRPPDVERCTSIAQSSRRTFRLLLLSLSWAPDRSKTLPKAAGVVHALTGPGWTSLWFNWTWSFSSMMSVGDGCILDFCLSQYPYLFGVLYHSFRERKWLAEAFCFMSTRSTCFTSEEWVPI